MQETTRCRYMKKPPFPSLTLKRNRRVFWRAGGLLALGFAGVMNLMAQPIQPEKVYFKDEIRKNEQALT